MALSFKLLAKYYFPNFLRKALRSLVSFEELDEVVLVVVGVVFTVVGVGVGTGVGVGATTAVATEGVHVSVKLSWVSSASLSNNCSSPLISWRNHVSSKTVPVILRTTQVSIISPLREKWVPILSLENVLRSNKSSLAAVGLIKR